MSTWWHKENGENTLKGVEDDDTNPPRLTAEDIAHFLRTSQKAREDFDVVYPTLLAAEQARLDAIVACNPRMTGLHTDYQTMLDTAQTARNRAGVRLTWMK